MSMSTYCVFVDIQKTTNQPKGNVMTRVLSYVVIDQAVEAAGIVGQEELIHETPQGVVWVRPVHNGEWLLDSQMAMWGEGDGFFESSVPESIEEYTPGGVVEEIVGYRIVPARDQPCGEGETPADETISKFIVSRETFGLWTFPMIVTACHDRQAELKFKEAEVWILETDGRLVQIW